MNSDSASPRPNILFLMSDQHRPDVTGYEGNDVVRTPVLDRLAEQAVVFRNAYTASPICVPGRQCLMSGQLPKTNGCEGWIDLPPNHLTFARQFARYAYQTTCCGKLHHEGPDQMQGWLARPYGDMRVNPRLLEGNLAEEFARYQPAPGQGKWSNQKEVERAASVYGPYQRFDDRTTQTANDYIEDYFVSDAYDRPGHHRPLLLKVSLLQPHYPFFTDREKMNYYMNRVPIYDEQPCDHPVLSLSQQNKPVQLSQRDIRRATAAYYGMIESIDSHYGSVLDRLEHVGENLDDWIIIYCSDHGEMLGQHGIWEKTRFYEGSVRVPLMIRWPKQYEHRVVHENVNLCDLFATLCDLAGLGIPEGLDSRSLVPLMRGEASNWQNETVSQYNQHHVMIKQDALKYQYYGSDGPEVLFDLEADPGETANVIDDANYAEALGRFRARLGELGHGDKRGE